MKICRLLGNLFFKLILGLYETFVIKETDAQFYRTTKKKVGFLFIGLENFEDELVLKPLKKLVRSISRSNFICLTLNFYFFYEM